MDPLLETLQQEILSAVEGLTPEQLSWHAPEKWCAAEVLEHLYLTYTGTVKGFERVVEAGKPLATATTLKQRVGRLVVTRFSYLPSRREAPPVARPRGLAQEKVRAEIGATIAALDDILRGVRRARKKLLDHPILGPLTAWQWRKFHRVHGRHHGKQIRRLRAMAGS
ncbi:MAG TPA: DUF1569 domain-containing protein [Candidatus Sulfotelmatobacter sp.]|nr:DUF1569 domain-containing protein [Candidatus Sulfotelmatobacter sp.]